MKIALVILLFCLLFIDLLLGQEKKEEQRPSIEFHGFVNLQAFYDSRQVLEAREGMYLFYPKNVLPDQNGKDINAQPGLNLLAMTSRLSCPLNGPNAFGAKTSGLIEADFTGVSNNDNNGFRLRHAYLTLEWKSRKLLIGHYWHPLYVAEIPTGTISLNSGGPFQSFSRAHQIRFTQKINKFELIGFAGTQRDYASEGPIGRSADYMRNAIIPNLNGMFHFLSGNNLLGLSIDYKWLMPALVTDKNYITSTTIGSMAAMAYAKFKFDNYELKFKGTWGQNLSEHLMLGGYAETSYDTNNGNATYTTFNQISALSVFEKTKGSFRPGILLGYLKTLGTELEVVRNIYGRGMDIGYIYRVSPRLVWWSGKTMIALEIEYTAVGYGAYDSFIKVNNTNKVSNLRLLFGAFYFF